MNTNLTVPVSLEGRVFGFQSWQHEIAKLVSLKVWPIHVRHKELTEQRLEASGTMQDLTQH
eukprot:3261533-Amphidinium_carterae.1